MIESNLSLTHKSVFFLYLVGAFDKLSSTLSSSARIVILTLVVICPVLMTIYLYCKREQLGQKEFIAKFFSAYEGIKQNKFSSIMYTQVFCIRRLLLVLMLLALHEKTYWLLQVYMVIQSLYFGYLTNVKPHEAPMHNILECFNELGLIVIQYMMFFFLVGTLEPENQWDYGTAATAIIAFVFLVNIIVLATITVKRLRLWFRKKMILRAHKKAMASKQSQKIAKLNKVKPENDNDIDIEHQSQQSSVNHDSQQLSGSSVSISQSPLEQARIIDLSHMKRLQQDDNDEASVMKINNILLLDDDDDVDRECEKPKLLKNPAAAAAALSVNNIEMIRCEDSKISIEKSIQYETERTSQGDDVGEQWLDQKFDKIILNNTCPPSPKNLSGKDNLGQEQFEQQQQWQSQILIVDLQEPQKNIDDTGDQFYPRDLNFEERLPGTRTPSAIFVNENHLTEQRQTSRTTRIGFASQIGLRDENMQENASVVDVDKSVTANHHSTIENQLMRGHTFKKAGSEMVINLNQSRNNQIDELRLKTERGRQSLDLTKKSRGKVQHKDMWFNEIDSKCSEQEYNKMFGGDKEKGRRQ